MSGAKIHLNALGPQDIFLTHKPENSYFKKAYRKHTNFANSLIYIEPSDLSNDKKNFKFGEKISFNIEKVSDLLNRLTIEVKIEGDNWSNKLNIVPETLYGLIEYIEITVGDKVLQNLSGEWMYIWHQLLEPTEKTYISKSAFASKYNKTNTIDELEQPDKHTLMLPLPFYFYNNPGLSIPLWAIQHQNINVNLKFRNFSCIANENQLSSDYIIKSVKLIGEFIELEQDEKRIFKDTALEYCINQTIFCGEEIIDVKNNQSSRKKIKINQQDLVKELIWVFKSRNNDFKPENFFNYWLNHDGENRNDHATETSILLNGRIINPRFKSSYYRNVNRWESHSGSNIINNDLTESNSIGMNCIYMYSFCLNPDLIKSTGILSMNKFNNIEMDLKINGTNDTRTILIFINKLNIIRINNGYLDILK